MKLTQRIPDSVQHFHWALLLTCCLRCYANS